MITFKCHSLLLESLSDNLWSGRIYEPKAGKYNCPPFQIMCNLFLLLKCGCGNFPENYLHRGTSSLQACSPDVCVSHLHMIGLCSVHETCQWSLFHFLIEEVYQKWGRGRWNLSWQCKCLTHCCHGNEATVLSFVTEKCNKENYISQQ